MSTLVHVAVCVCELTLTVKLVFGIIALVHVAVCECALTTSPSLAFAKIAIVHVAVCVTGLTAAMGKTTRQPTMFRSGGFLCRDVDISITFINP